MEKSNNKFVNWIQKNKLDLFVYLGYLIILAILIILAVAPQYEAAKIAGQRYSATAIELFGFQIQWYAIFILSGIVLAATMAYYEFKRLGWDPEDLLDGVLIIVPLSIIGARLYYVIFDSPAKFVDIFKIWEGGLAIHGGIIVAVIGIIIFSRKKKLSAFVLGDLLALGLLMGQIAGRWGNFMNAEAHSSQIVENKFLIGIIPGFIKHQMQFSGSSMLSSGFYHPTFLYESLWNFVGLTALLVIRRKKYLRAGDMVGLYLIWYGLGRSFLEAGYREDQLDAILGIPVNVLMSLVFVGAGVLYLILKRVFIKDQLFYVDALVYEIEYPWEKVVIDEELESDNL